MENKVSSTPLEEDNVLSSFKTPMQKRVKEHPSLSHVLECMPIIDYPKEVKKHTNSDKAPTEDDIIIIFIYKLLKLLDAIGYGLVYYRKKHLLYIREMWDFIDELLINEWALMLIEKSGMDKLFVSQLRFKQKLEFQLKSIACFLPSLNKSKIVKINLKNGTYHFNGGKGELRDFSKDDFLQYQLSFSYDPNAKAPFWQEFLDEIMPEKDKQLVFHEFLAYVFTTKMKLEKALILYGTGSNGKSVIYSVVEKLIGFKNIVGFPMESLCDEKGYSRAELDGKLLNFSSELGNKKFNVDTFKKLVSNEPVEARTLFEKPYMLENDTKFIFNANVLPTAEISHGFFRRMLIIPLNVTIQDEAQDIDLAEKIYSTELPGIFNLVLEGLVRLIANKKFSHSSSVKLELKRYEMESNSVHVFVEDDGWEKSPTSRISLEDLYFRYKEFCLTNGYKVLQSRNFGKRLRALGFEYERGTNGYTFVCCQKKYDKSSSIIKETPFLNYLIQDEKNEKYSS